MLTASGAGAVVLVALLGIVGAGALVSPPPIDPVAPPSPASFDPQRVRRGAQLAAVGDCASCHTARGGAAYAGGVGVPTPFGTVYGTNITPEPQTGIGNWTLEAFRRALREGVSRDGHLLYPAFPYNHFTHLSDADIDALYAFVMTRDAVRAQAPHNKLMFPLQFRPLLAGWNMLYLRQGPVPATTGQSAEYNRGAYLVEGLGHCAACHTPRNVLGAEKRDAYLAGGTAEGWHAPALNTASPSPVPWTAEALATYLRSGLADEHGMTAGPMRDVVTGLSQADMADVKAIATYIAAQMGPPDAQRQARAQEAKRKSAQPSLVAVQPSQDAPRPDDTSLGIGAMVYQTTCGSCHDLGRGPASDSALQLPLAVALYLPQPDNLVRIIQGGIEPLPGRSGRWMPPLAGSLTDQQQAALVTWLRWQASDQLPWPDAAKAVGKANEEQP